MNEREWRRMKWFVCGIFLLTIWVSSLAAGAESSGSMALKLPQKADGVQLTLYRIGRIEETGEEKERICRGEGAFTGVTVKLRDLDYAETADAEAERLIARIGKTQAQGTQQNADTSGRMVFSHLEPALYLIAQTGGADQVEIQASLLPLPYYEEEAGEWIYDVVLAPKYSYEPESEETCETGEDEETENSDSSEYEEETDREMTEKEQKKAAVRTGDDTPWERYVILLAVSGLVILTVLVFVSFRHGTVSKSV